MTVYVDDMYRAPAGRFGRLRMSHMTADTDEELVSMARRIGVDVRWHQHPGAPDSHFDIAMSKRRLAIAAGAVEVSWRQLGCMTYLRRVTGRLGVPETAESEVRALLSVRTGAVDA